MELLDQKIERLLRELSAKGQRRELTRPKGIDFSHNDYLGLSGHPEIVAEGKRYLELGSAGARGSRLLGGNTEAHEACEAELAQFFEAPAALFFSSGYLANLAAVTALAPLVDAIHSDALNHASLIDGVRLSGRPKQIYPHNDLKFADDASRSLIITESLFSMDGDTMDWDRLRGLQDRDAWLLVDEAHAAGVFTDEGRGLSAQGRRWDRLCVTVTLGKAFGVGGAALLCSLPVKEWIVNQARSFIYTTAAPPVVPAMVRASLRVMKAEGATRRQALWRRVEATRAELETRLPERAIVPRKGLWNRRSMVIPVHTPGNDNALRLSQNMRESGFEVRAIRYPTVALGTERLRLSLTLCPTETETAAMVEKLVNLWTAYS